MNIFCLGINHRSAPIDVREKLWFSANEIPTILSFYKEKYFKETVLVSTCNRTELYYVQHNTELSGEPLWKILAQQKGAELFFQENHFYSISSLNVVKHIFGVASGIDSMVLGDVQILNQMKEAFALAVENQTAGFLLNRLFTAAFHVGKRARAETEIAEGAVSVSYAAAELASKIFEDLSNHTALLIGAGETGELTAKHLAGRNLGNLIITNRTRKRAEDLAGKLGGRVADFENLQAELSHVDIVISSVEAPSYILSAGDIRQAMKARGNKPLFVIDIGLPRNIDPESNTIDNVFLHDMDALNQIISINLAHRNAEVPKIQQIILDELTRFKNWHDSLEVIPTIQQLRDRFESIRSSEVEKHRHHFAADKYEELEILTKRIVNKILHTPMANLKNGTPEHSETETRNKIHTLRHLFGLEKKD
jgi:glutamyl-tRNA reductase